MEEEEVHCCIETLLFLSDISDAIQNRVLTPENQWLLIAHEGRVMWEARQFYKLRHRHERGL